MPQNFPRMQTYLSVALFDVTSFLETSCYLSRMNSSRGRFTEIWMIYERSTRKATATTCINFWRKSPRKRESLSRGVFLNQRDAIVDRSVEADKDKEQAIQCGFRRPESIPLVFVARACRACPYYVINYRHKVLSKS